MTGEGDLAAEAWTCVSMFAPQAFLRGKYISVARVAKRLCFMWSGHAVRGYPIGFFNPVTPTQCKSRNPNGYFQHPASSAYFQSRFCLQTPNPGLQIRKPIPQPVTPIPITPTGELIVRVGTYTPLLNKRLTLFDAVANLRSVVGRDGICVMSDQGSCLF